MRMSEHMLSTMTQLHFDLLVDLLKLCTSHYTQVSTVNDYHIVVFQDS